MTNTNSWGSEHFKVTGLNFKDVSDFSLESACKLLPARVKQAFYAAGMRKGVIKRRTWDGCAFNEGSLEAEFVKQPKAVAETGVKSYELAAQAFGTSVAIVRRFINAWDRSTDRWATDREATKALMGILDGIGLFSDPARPEVRVVSIKVFESTITETVLKEQLETASIDSFDDDFKKVLAEVENLLELEPVS